MNRVRAALAAAVLVLGASVAQATGVAPLPLVADCVSAGANHAAVVVEHGDGRVVSACVAFASPTISGLDLLRQSGIQYATSSYAGLGDAACQLDGEPATYPAGCWSSSSPYWVLFVARAGGTWSIAPVGMSSLTFGDGDAEGFRYQPQTGAAQPPSRYSRCPATPTPTPSPKPTATPGSTPANPRPTPTVRPTVMAGSGATRPTARAPVASARAPVASASAPVASASAPVASASSPVASASSPVASASATATSGTGTVSADTTTGSTTGVPSASPGGAVGGSSASAGDTGASATTTSSATDPSPAAATTWLGALLAVVILGGFGLVAARSRGRGRGR